MSEEDLHAPQANHAEEVLHLVLPADHQPTKVTEPSEKSQTAAYVVSAIRRLHNFALFIRLKWYFERRHKL
jgi:hypothetical protein